MRISFRENFDNPAAFGPISTREGDGPIIERYLRDLTGTLLIHGYHNSASAAEASYAKIMANMPELRMHELLWPGGELALGFPVDVLRADMAGLLLRSLLCGLDDTSALDIQTHSLGARVALRALKGHGIKIRHLILSAPAVENDSLAGEFAGIMENVASLNIFCSSNDPVLRKDFPLGSFGRQALGLYGPVGPTEMWVPRLRVFDCSKVCTSHGGYRDGAWYYPAWRSIIDGTAAPGVTVL